MLNVSLSGPFHRRCDGVSRRDFIRIGALGPLGLSLPGLLSARQSVALGTAGGATVRPRAKSVLLVFLGGGLSHHDTFDPKPEAVSEIRGQYGQISTSVPGLRISDQLPKMAACMDKVCLVRSGTHENDHHETATNWVLSG